MNKRNATAASNVMNGKIITSLSLSTKLAASLAAFACGDICIILTWSNIFSRLSGENKNRPLVAGFVTFLLDCRN